MTGTRRPCQPVLNDVQHDARNTRLSFRSGGGECISRRFTCVLGLGVGKLSGHAALIANIRWTILIHNPHLHDQFIRSKEHGNAVILLKRYFAHFQNVLRLELSPGVFLKAEECENCFVGSRVPSYVKHSMRSSDNM